MVSLDVLDWDTLVRFPGVKHYPPSQFENYRKEYKIDLTSKKEFGKYEPAFAGGAKYLVNVRTRRLAIISVGAGSVNYREDDAKSRLCLYPYPYFITPLPYGDKKQIGSDLVPDAPNGTQEVLLSLQWRSPGCSIKQCDRFVLGTFVIKERIKSGNFDCIMLIRKGVTITNCLQQLQTYVTMLKNETNKKMTAITMSRDFNRKQVYQKETELKEKKEKLEKMENEQEKLNENMQSIMAEIETKEVLMKNMKETINKLCDEKDHNLSQIHAMSTEIDAMSNDIKGLKEDYQAANDRENTVYGQVQDLREELKKEKRANREMQKAHRETKKQLDEKTKEHDFEKKRKDNERYEYRGRPKFTRR